MPLELFFPIGEQSRSAVMQVAKAKHVCNRCSVVTECLNTALETAEPEGISGGLTTFERNALRRHLRVLSDMDSARGN